MCSAEMRWPLATMMRPSASATSDPDRLPDGRPEPGMTVFPPDSVDEPTVSATLAPVSEKPSRPAWCDVSAASVVRSSRTPDAPPEPPGTGPRLPAVSGLTYTISSPTWSRSSTGRNLRPVARSSFYYPCGDLEPDDAAVLLEEHVGDRPNLLACVRKHLHAT